MIATLLNDHRCRAAADVRQPVRKHLRLPGIAVCSRPRLNLGFAPGRMLATSDETPGNPGLRPPITRG